MAVPLSQRVLTLVADAAGLYYRLLLIAGPAQSGKTHALKALATTQNWPLINVNLRLSELLLELTQRQGALRVPQLLDDIICAAGGRGCSPRGREAPHVLRRRHHAIGR